MNPFNTRMNMIRCIAIDDEPLALQQLTTYLKKVPFFELVGSCLSASEATKILSEQAVDAVFLDINMPDLNGLELVQSLVHQPLIVFTTAYSEYAIEGYKTNAVDYLLKPYGMADIQRAANKVKERYDLQQAAAQARLSASSGTPQAEASDDGDFMFLKTDYRVVRVCISDIIYVKGMGEYLRIYTKGQQKPVIVLLSMKRMEERLAGHAFMRVHRSFIINLACIREMNRSGIVLEGGEEIPVGDTYRAAIGEYIDQRSLGK